MQSGEWAAGNLRRIFGRRRRGADAIL